MNTKRCLRCGGTFALVDFQKARARPDGHSCYCKSCASHYQQARRLGVENVTYLPAPTEADMRARGAARRALEAMRDEKAAQDYF